MDNGNLRGGAVTSNVDRLKTLLFDAETQTLAELSARIDALAAEAGVSSQQLLTALGEMREASARTQGDFALRLDAINARVGTREQLEESVSEIIDGALRRAEKDKHAVVSDAVAPFVVNTVRAEIRNSKDELVEALYPVTGRIVKAYVASAMKDLADQINRRLEMNPVMLRVRSLATGRPVAELAIADSQQLRVEEIYLIRRGTGELVARWPQATEGSNRDQVMTGVLTAINEFATEAFAGEGSSLRHIDLGSDRVFLRASQTYLIAAKCSGSAPLAVESVVDEEFLAAMERLGLDARDDNGRLAPGVLDSLSAGLEKRIGETQDSIRGERLGASPVKILAWLIGLPLVAWLGWSTYANYKKVSVHNAIAGIIDTAPEIKGYPVRVSVGWLGKTAVVAGLTPTIEAKANVLKRISNALPHVALDEELSVVPNALSDVEPELERLRRETATLQPELNRVRDSVGEIEDQVRRDALRREFDRALRLIADAGSTLAPVQEVLDGSANGLGRKLDSELRAAQTLLTAARGQTEQTARRVDDIVQPLAPLAKKLAAAGRDLSVEASKGLGYAPAGPKDVATPALPELKAEAIANEAERILMTLVAMRQAISLKRSLSVPVSVPARERLEAWTRANAIFFLDETNYRDAALANRQFDELASLMKAADAVVRVVGYTDAIGTQGRNSPLSQTRADTVTAALVSRGVPRERLQSLGRLDSRDISRSTGTGSPNRRVEFEVGFVGERAP